MSNKNYIRLWLASLSLLVSGACLYSIRGLLPDVTVKIGIALMVCAAGYLAYLVHKFYVRLRLNHLELRSKRLEIAQQEQNLLDQETTRQLALGQFALNSHVLRSRIYPDQRGFFPVLASDDMQTLPGQLDLLMLPQYNRPAGRERTIEVPEQAESLHSAIPSNVRYEDIASQIPRGHALLGVSAEGVETCDFGHLMTVWIVGGSSTGKSNTVAIKLDEAVRLGRNIGIILIDPHARKEDSLYNKIRCYENRFLMPVAVNEEQILQALTAFEQEFNRRLEIGGKAETDILLVCDEVSNVVDSDNPEIARLIKKIARICGQESRGFGMFGWFISQDAAGLAWLRKRAMTVIAHKLNMMSERKLACNEDMELARSMDSWPIGRVAVYGLHFNGALVAQMPVKRAAYDEGEKIYPDDEMEELQPLPNSTRAIFQSQQWEDWKGSSEDNGEAGGKLKDTDPEAQAVVLKNFLLAARKKRDQGISIDAILREAGLPTGGYRNQELKAALDALVESE